MFVLRQKIQNLVFFIEIQNRGFKDLEIWTSQKKDTDPEHFPESGNTFANRLSKRLL